MLKGNEKILIVRLTALGDCIHTIPLVCAIKKQFPNIFVGWAVSEKCKTLIENNPVIDKVHIIPKNNKQEYLNKILEIRKENYDIAIDSQELLKSGIISFFSGAKLRLSHDKCREFAHIFSNKKLSYIPLFDCSRHVIERNMDFARYLGIKDNTIDFVLPNNNAKDENYVSELLINTNPALKNIIISPSTTWITKFWTVENWAEVINNLSYQGNIIITGSNADKNYTDEILKLVDKDKVVNLTGKTNISQLKILFEKSDIVITPDSGSAHLASAVKNPIIVCLFGSTSDKRNGAYGNKNINLSASLSCQPCYKKICKFTDDIPECIKQISPQTVIENVKKILENE